MPWTYSAFQLIAVMAAIHAIKKEQATPGAITNEQVIAELKKSFPDVPGLTGNCEHLNELINHVFELRFHNEPALRQGVSHV